MFLIINSSTNRRVSSPKESFAEAKKLADELHAVWADHYVVAKVQEVYCTQSIEEALNS